MAAILETVAALSDCPAWASVLLAPAVSGGVFARCRYRWVICSGRAETVHQGNAHAAYSRLQTAALLGR